MKSRTRRVLVGVAALAVAGAGALSTAGVANAAASPWEPDPNSNGSLVFYDATGHVLTGGNNLSHIADYVAASGLDASNGIKATLQFAAPNHTQSNTLNWFVAQASASTSFPNAGAPAPVKGPGFANPLVTVGASDGNLQSFLGAATLDSTPGYANIIQVRVKTNSSGTTFWSTNISYNSANGTWAVNDPSVTSTTTSISSTPSSPQVVGFGNITLNATVAPASAGTVQFFEGSTPVGSPQSVTSASGAASTTYTPAAGPATYHFTAVFSPAGGTPVQGSTSSDLPFVVNNPVPTTQTALSANQTTFPAFSPVLLTANVTTPSGASGSPTSAGSVKFFDGASLLGTAATDDGTTGEFQLTYSGFATGPHSVTAQFVPADPNALAGSVSPAVALTATAPTCAGAPTLNPITGEPGCQDTQAIQATVTPGTLTITTPYTPTNPFVLPDMVLNPAGTLLSTSATFPKATDNPITVTSSIAGDPNWTVSVTATDLTGLSQPSRVINGENLGLTAGALVGTPSNPAQTVTFTDIAAGNGVAPGAAPTGAGLKAGPHTFAQSAGGGNGTTQMKGTLTLNAPTTTQADTYTGTITFSVA